MSQGSWSDTSESDTSEEGLGLVSLTLGLLLSDSVKELIVKATAAVTAAQYGDYDIYDACCERLAQIPSINRELPRISPQEHNSEEKQTARFQSTLSNQFRFSFDPG